MVKKELRGGGGGGRTKRREKDFEKGEEERG